jgi:hypothetical protein
MQKFLIFNCVKKKTITLNSKAANCVFVGKLHFLILCFRLFFYLQATSGGFVEVVNREAGNKIEYYPLVGKKTEREFEYHWDLEKPYHNLVSGLDDPPFLSVSDLTENVRKCLPATKKF